MQNKKGAFERPFRFSVLSIVVFGVSRQQAVAGIEERNNVYQLGYLHFRIDVHGGRIDRSSVLTRQLVKILIRNDMVRVDNGSHQITIGLGKNQITTQRYCNWTRAGIGLYLSTVNQMTLIATKAGKSLLPSGNISLQYGEAEITHIVRIGATGPKGQ